MKTKILVFLCIVIPLILSSCSELTNQEALKDTGLFDEHLVGHFTPQNGYSLNLQGQFFLGSGSINGEGENHKTITFNWSPQDNRFVNSTVPENKFITQLDETRTSPVVVFKFADYWLTSLTPYRDSSWGDPGEPYPQEALDNLQSLLETDNLLNVIVYINSADLASEPALAQNPNPAQ